MGREIRFRAWDGELGEMLDHDSAHWFYGSNGLEAGYNAGHSHPTIGEGDWVELEIMQYTGLKDSNGVEIWEGDILDGPTFGLRVVEYNQSTCGFNCLEALPMYGDDASVVVGNIHENPDLRSTDDDAA